MNKCCNAKNIEVVWMQLNGQCNLKCKYCYRFNIEKDKYHLSPKRVEDVLATLAKTGSKTIIFSGGEPTLDANLGNYIAKASRDYGHVTIIATNGTRITPGLLEIINEHGAVLQVSLDTVDKERYKYLCGADKLDVVLKNIENCLENEIEISLSGVISRANFSDLVPLVEYALDKNISFIHIGHLISTGRANCTKELREVPLMELWRVLLPLQLENYQYIGIDLVEDFVLRFIDGKKTGYCASLEGKGMEILNTGEVLACGLIFEKDLSYGHLGKEKFSAIYSRFLAKKGPCFDYNKLDQCNNCNAIIICGYGGCRALAYIFNGSYYGAYPYCEDTQKIFTELQELQKAGVLDEYLSFLKGLPLKYENSTRPFSARLF